LATNPVTLAAPENKGIAGGACLIDPADSGCKLVVVVAGKGTFTLNSDGKTTFQAVAGFFGRVVVEYRVTDGYARSASTTVTVDVLRALPAVSPAGGTTLINRTITVTPGITLTPEMGKATICLVDPADNVCKNEVTIPEKGRFVLNPNGSVSFIPARGFIGEARVQLRVTNELGDSKEAPIVVVVTDVPGAQNGATKGTTPVTLAPVNPVTPESSVCLIDPTDGICKNQVTLPGVGTWTQNQNGTVGFVAVAGYLGTTTVMQRFSRASFEATTPFTVVVAKKRGPVTITISGFADGSPVLTAAIRAQINMFLRAHRDYRNLYCIGYTEGPTVLPTDRALSRQRSLNACNFVKSGLGKSLILRSTSAKQGVIEADKFRRITITLTD
jgi:CshA-type fibril repeat protein